MSRLEAEEANVRRLYPQLLEVLEGEEMADAGCALCTALTILAFREGYSLRALIYLTRSSITQGWRELKKWGLPAEVSPKPTTRQRRNH